MDACDAARRWGRTWQDAWPRKDVEAIASLYRDDCLYRALVHREPERGVRGVRAYLTREFAVEEKITCSFGEPVCGDGRAAVQWWASWTEGGRDLTMAGVTVLRFDNNGLVVDHRDYWNEVDGRSEAFPDW
ncbi:MAG: nuclear transport factor 2 family protein [Candidatus Dormibacteraeota bacterium]|nr:nuclear transport factor 2 family protein [Candidatus Dormibacteraeota bacterium]MBV9526379.1 nuclear transport factor 2 family protein [Candidatus Dormibacteraeota bacterium]